MPFWRVKLVTQKHIDKHINNVTDNQIAKPNVLSRSSVTNVQAPSTKSLFSVLTKCNQKVWTLFPWPNTSRSASNERRYEPSSNRTFPIRTTRRKTTSAQTTTDGNDDDNGFDDHRRTISYI